LRQSSTIITQPSTRIDQSMRIWSNGEVRDASQPILTSDNPGWLVGLGVFESLLGKEGEPCLVQRHLQRLRAGAERLGIALAPDEETLVSALRLVMKENGLCAGLARLRITVVPGTVLVTAIRFLPYPETVDVVTSPFLRNERSPLAGIKATAYAENLLALQEAQGRGAAEAILGNTRGELCEGATSNIFLVREDGCVVTPPIGSGCLPGVMRGVVIERLRDLGISVREEACPLEDLATCREAFLTSSLRGVQAVERVDGRKLQAPGEVTARLRG
jgi:branched-chain amino acid aminotransferase